MVLIRDLLTAFDTKFDVNKISEALLMTGYDEELETSEFQKPEHTTEDGRDKYVFKSKEVNIIIYDNPIAVEINTGDGGYELFDDEGNLIEHS